MYHKQLFSLFCLFVYLYFDLLLSFLDQNRFIGIFKVFIDCKVTVQIGKMISNLRPKFEILFYYSGKGLKAIRKDLKPRTQILDLGKFLALTTALA